MTDDPETESDGGVTDDPETESESRMPDDPGSTATDISSLTISQWGNVGSNLRDMLSYSIRSEAVDKNDCMNTVCLKAWFQNIIVSRTMTSSFLYAYGIVLSARWVDHKT